MRDELGPPADDGPAAEEGRDVARLVRRFRVEGRVQGVGFRAWTRRVADELSLSGSVRNLADGSVEVLAGGTGERVRAFEELLREGPRAARVRSVEAYPVERASGGGDEVGPSPLPLAWGVFRIVRG